MASIILEYNIKQNGEYYCFFSRLIMLILQKLNDDDLEADLLNREAHVN